jgi:alpha-beta hydrolase superfamily lysophospholipase
MTSANAVRRLRYSAPVRRRDAKAPSFAAASAVVIGALAAAALLNYYLAKKAERDNPATGRFLHVNGVRLHYIERGSGEGASVAVALALKYPDMVRGLVLASGYYYPTARPDVAMGAPALPLVGDILSHTLSPLISRAIWPLMMAKIFGPRSVPGKFGAFPKEMALRPSQIRASAAESALMIPDAFKLRNRYAELKMPVVIIAGEQDRLIDIDAQSARLHSDISQSMFNRVAGNGHMIQQTATDQVMSAIRDVTAGAPAPQRA